MKGAKPQVTTTTLDKGTQDWVAQMRQSATGSLNNPLYQQGLQGFGTTSTLGNMGLSALTGSPGAQNQFMNPFTQSMNPFFAQQRAQAVQGANDQSTLAGAFGGDRSGIAAAAAGNLADQNQAGFQYQGFNDAMNRALQAANLGFGANQQLAGIPGQQAQAMGMATGPYGQTQTTPQQRNVGAGILGGAATGAQFGPWGALAGGILGAF